MQYRPETLLIGPDYDSLQPLVNALQGQSALALQTFLFSHDLQPLWQSNGASPPRVLLGCLSQHWREDLDRLRQQLPAQRPPLLLASPVEDQELLRAALQVGARDLLQPPYDTTVLSARLTELAHEDAARRSRHSARLLAVMNAKGGSGASLLAANIATLLADRLEQRTLLLDLEVQFSSQGSYLNLGGSDGLLRALENADALDGLALAGLARIHPDSGLHLLASSGGRLVAPDGIAPERLEALLQVLDQNYQQVVVDLPRRVDDLTGLILERLDRLLVVTQQSVAHLANTKRLITLARDHIGVPDERILLVINRFDRRAEVTRNDYDKAFPKIAQTALPGDFARVTESINLGVPVVSGASSRLGRALHELTARLVPEADERRPASGWRRWLGLGTRPQPTGPGATPATAKPR